MPPSSHSSLVEPGQDSLVKDMNVHAWADETGRWHYTLSSVAWKGTITAPANGGLLAVLRAATAHVESLERP